jgi:RNA polymerase sigma factor (sigma-70 family)
VANHSTTPSHSLIGDLYQRHAPRLLLYVYRHVPSLEDAEDLLLEVFIAALENPHLNKLSEQEQLAWLWRVAHNKFVDFYRRSTRRPSLSLENMQQELYDEKDCTPEAIALKSEEHTSLRLQLASLSAIQQQVLHLRFAENLHCPEIAKRLNKSDGAIRTMLSRILHLLRNTYTNKEEERSHE